MAMLVLITFIDVRGLYIDGIERRESGAKKRPSSKYDIIVTSDRYRLTDDYRRQRYSRHGRRRATHAYIYDDV